jgi:acetate kinase
MKALRDDDPLCIPPFDYRGSLETTMLGWRGDLTLEQSSEIAAAKQVIYDGFKAAIVVKKSISAFAAALGEFDTLVFAGGAGENTPRVRARICDGLGFLGIGLEEKRNAANAGVISVAASRIAVRVIHTDEERMIAKTVCRALGFG